MSKLSRLFVSLVLVALFSLTVSPAIAASYVPNATAPTWVAAQPNAVQPGQSSVVNFSKGTFRPYERVHITVSGVSGSGIVLTSFVKASTSVSIVKTAAADGSLTVRMTLPAGAAGNYVVKGTGQSSGVSAEVTIAAVQSSAAGSALVSSSGAPLTIGLAIALLALIAVCVVLAVLLARHRSRQRTTA